MLRRKEAGCMVAVVDGRYTAVPLTVTGTGRKRVDTARFYDSEEYRPKVAEVLGTPMFLH
jgi:6-phosphofructokinase 1